MDVAAGLGNDRVNISLAAKVGPSGHSSWSKGSTGPASLCFDNNHFDAGDGNDVVRVAGKTDFSNSSNKLFNNSFEGGSGNDTLDFHSWSQALKVDLSVTGGPNLDLGKGLTNSVDSFESFVGTAFGDRFTFGADTNVKVSGGGGADWFSFESTQPTGSVVLTDFKPGKDKLAIDISGSGTATHLLQVSDVHNANGGNFPTCIYDTTGKDAGSLYFDPTGGSSDDAVLIALLSNKAALAASDILFV